MKLGLLTDIFNTVPHQILFVGHDHLWSLATPQGIINWQGERPIYLDEGRYFVVVGALFFQSPLPIHRRVPPTATSRPRRKLSAL